MAAVTTRYDIGDVRSHTLEIGFARLAFFTKPFWIGLLIWLGAVLLLWDMTGKDVTKHPVIFYGGCLASLLFIQWVAYSMSEEGAMERHARKERAFPADRKLKAVRDKDWARFVSRLKQRS